MRVKILQVLLAYIIELRKYGNLYIFCLSKNLFQVDSLRGFTNDASKVQACANSIALIARSLSRDENFLSPFAKNARASGFKGVMGGKEDDVTVILAAVNYNTSNAAD